MEDTFTHMKKPIVNLPEVPPVKLPTVMGMRPGIFILILMILAILLVVFLVGFLPGILKGGKNVTFTSPLSNVAVTVDGTYKGGTPSETWIDSGTHEVQFTKDGVVLQTVDVKVGHPVFFTWLAPRRMTISNTSLNVDMQLAQTITRSFLDKVAAWSRVTDFDDRYHYPPLFSNWASDMVVASQDIPSPQLQELLGQAWQLAVAHITSKTILEDATEASGILSRAGVSFETVTSSQLMQAATDLFSNETSTTDVGLAANPPQVVKTPATLAVDDMAIKGFTYQPAQFVMGTTVLDIWPAVTMAGVEVDTGSFSLASQEVTEYQWARFIEENPKWAKANTTALVAEGLVDEYYLAGISPTTVVQSGRPIRNISYHAAQAYCQWLSDKTGRHVFVPTQQMWSVAATEASTYSRTLVSVGDETVAPLGLLGGVWEMTSSPFIPLGRLSGNLTDLVQTIDLLDVQTEIIVKGGSYINIPTDITINTVGTAAKATCSEYTGFRIAWE